MPATKGLQKSCSPAEKSVVCMELLSQALKWEVDWQQNLDTSEAIVPAQLRFGNNFGPSLQSSKFSRFQNGNPMFFSYLFLFLMVVTCCILFQGFIMKTRLQIGCKALESCHPYTKVKSRTIRTRAQRLDQRLMFLF